MTDQKISTRHLIGIRDLSVSDIKLLLETGKQFKEVLQRPVKKVPSLRDVTIVNLFYENSTRTRISVLTAGASARATGPDSRRGGR